MTTSSRSSCPFCGASMMKHCAGAGCHWQACSSSDCGAVIRPDKRAMRDPDLHQGEPPIYKDLSGGAA